MDKKKILNIFVDDITVEGAVEEIISRIKSGKKSYMITPNAEIGYACLKDKKLADIINGADIVLPDGAGLVLASRIVKNPLSQKTPGAVTAQSLLPRLNDASMSLFILGGKADTCKLACENIHRDYPNIKLGYRDGYFENDGEAVTAVNEFTPDVLFVCLGAPKQELFIGRNLDKLNCGFAAGLGGTVDILAGTVQAAPEFYVKHSLEWLYRLINQPKRFFRMLNIPKYLLRAVFYKD